MTGSGSIPLRSRLGPPAFAILAVCSALSILHSIVFIALHATPGAFFDLWFWVSDFERWVNGHYTLHDLIKPHYGQHRIATTRLLLLMDSLLFKMSGTSVIAINALLLATLGVLLWRLARLDGVARSGWNLPPVFWVALMIAVSQVENLIFPFQVQFAIACLSATCAVALLSAAAADGQARPVRCAIAAGLTTTITIYSMASGVLLVPGLIVLLALRRSRLSVWLAFVPIAVFSVAAFFFHRPSEPHPPLLDAGLAVTRILYVGNYLASSLTGFPAIAAPVGLCALALFFLACWSLARGFALAGRRVPSGDAAFVAIAIFVASCGPAATLTNRLGMGAQAALVSRYATMSLLFAAALFALFSRWGARTEARAGGPAWRRDFALPALATAVIVVMNAPIYDAIAAGWHRAVLADWQLLRNNVGVEGPAPVIFLGKVDDVRDQVRFLHARGLNMFAASEGPPADLLLRLRQADPARLPACRGFVDDAYAIDDTAFLLRGWLSDPAGLRSLKWVGVIDADGTVLGAARALTDRPDVQTALHMRQPAHGFEAGFRRQGGEAVSAHPGPLRIFGIDADAAQPLCLLPHALAIGPLQITPLSELTDLRPSAGGIAVSGFAAVPDQALPFAGSVWRAGPGATWRLTLPGQPRSGRPGSAEPGSAQPGQDRALVVPFQMFAGPANGTIVFHFADGTTLAARLGWLWDRPVWCGVVVPAAVQAAHGGARSAELQAEGRASFAVGSPQSAVLRPSWSRLY